MARKIEDRLGLRVVRHPIWKKPAGIDGVVRMFPEHCSTDELVMIGDRVLTDVAFGNLYGMLTIHSAMLTPVGDNKTAAKVRNVELPWMRKLVKSGVSAPKHRLYRADICTENLLEEMAKNYRS